MRRRDMTVKRITTGAVAGLVAFVAVACGSSGGAALRTGSGGGGGSASPTSPGQPAGFSVRAFPKAGPGCPAGPGVGGRLQPLDVSQITRFVICGQQVPFGNQHTVQIARSDSRFAVLARYLARPDGGGQAQRICPMYATVPLIVLAETASGWYVVHVPTDGCQHYAPGLLNLVTRLRS